MAFYGADNFAGMALERGIFCLAANPLKQPMCFTMSACPFVLHVLSVKFFA